MVTAQGNLVPRTITASTHHVEPPLDRSAVWGLVGSNLLTLVLALALKWPLATLLWPFWLQSVVIGYFSRKRMLALRDFTTAGMTMGSRREAVPEDETGLRRVANFFTLHYGFFHLIYAVFLWAMRPALTPLDWAGMLTSAVGFILAHRHSYQRNVEEDLKQKQSLTKLMLLPYARIIPMHLSLLVGSWLIQSRSTLLAGFALILFTLLKTAADLTMHYFEHRNLRRVH
jgi:Family of unknown function (DUF6498)